MEDLVYWEITNFFAYSIMTELISTKIKIYDLWGDVYNWCDLTLQSW